MGEAGLLFGALALLTCIVSLPIWAVMAFKDRRKTGAQLLDS